MERPADEKMANKGGKRLVRISCYTLGSFMLAAIIIFAISAIGLTAYGWKIGLFAPPDWSLLEDRRATSVILDEQGVRLREVCDYCREFAALTDMGRFPEFAVKVEDKHFWERRGAIDITGIARAAFENIKNLKIAQGGSTITQQLAKNTLAIEQLEKERTRKRVLDKWERKFREIYLATILEWHLYRKYGSLEKARQEILERYLNLVNCGGNYYGVKACAHRWFEKEQNKLNPAEYAWLMVLWRKPRYANLLNTDPKESLEARNAILARLANEGAISWREKEEYSNYLLPKRPEGRETDPCSAGHAAELARLIVKKQTTVADEGLQIHTTLNCEWNRVAAEALLKSMDAMKQRNPTISNDLWGAALAIDARNGDIKVMVQYPSFAETEYRADQIRRHPGSAAKVFGVLLHLMRGGRLSAQDAGTGPYACNDLPLSLYLGEKAGRKYFHNFPYVNLPQYLGRTDLLTGITQSRNLCFLSLIRGISGGIGLYDKDDLTEILLRLKISLPQTNGPDILSEKLAARMGTDRRFLDPGHTGIIGSFEISLWETVRAWSAFYGGVMVEPRIVDKVMNDSEVLPLDFSPRFYGNVLIPIWIETQKEILRRQEVERLWKEELASRAEARRLNKPHADKSRRTIYLQVLKTLKFDEENLAGRAPLEAERISLALIRSLRAPVELEHGTANLVRRGDEEHKIPKLDFDIACKTGTATRENKETGKGETTDNWIVCRTVSHIMAVWIGRKNNLSLETDYVDPKTGRRWQETGGGNALPVLIKTFAKIYETFPKEKFPDSTDPKKPFIYSPTQKLPSALEGNKESELNYYQLNDSY